LKKHCNGWCAVASIMGSDNVVVFLNREAVIAFTAAASLLAIGLALLFL